MWREAAGGALDDGATVAIAIAVLAANSASKTALAAPKAAAAYQIALAKPHQQTLAITARSLDLKHHRTNHPKAQDSEENPSARGALKHVLCRVQILPRVVGDPNRRL